MSSTTIVKLLKADIWAFEKLSHRDYFNFIGELTNLQRYYVNELGALFLKLEDVQTILPAEFNITENDVSVWVVPTSTLILMPC